MTSDERREIRYQRRKAERYYKRMKAVGWRDCFGWVFQYHHLYRSYQRSRKGVGWKYSVQRYIVKAPLQVYRTRKRLIAGKYKARPFRKFHIIERGKLRYIQSLYFYDRIVQKCLCDYALVPILKRRFINDNCACIKGKGQHYASKRLKEFLRRHYRRFGNDGYALLFDFSKFFERISHKLIKKLILQNITDTDLRRLLYQLVDDFGSRGLGLGSQISQILALTYADGLDHLIKEVYQVGYYIRYNDDGVLIHPNKGVLISLLNVLREYCSHNGIVLNWKKTQVVKLSHGFVFLKARYYLTKTGKVVKKLPKKSCGKMRKKLRKIAIMIQRGQRPLEAMLDCYTSWKGHAKHFNAWHAKRNMQGVVCFLMRQIETAGRDDLYGPDRAYCPVRQVV